MIDSKITQKRISELCRTYRSEPQIGLVLGAGVSCVSGVPLYLKMALDLCKLAHDGNLLRSDAPLDAVAFLNEQAELAQRDYEKVVRFMAVSQITPEEIALFVKTYLADEQELAKCVKETLYRKIDTRSHDMVSRKTFEENDTLDSVIRFCAALPGSLLAPQTGRRIETNPKVGGILTTNYDNLVEGSFGSKFGKKLLKPVGRVGARESLKDRRVIPVYHIHGYVSYVPPEDDPGEVKASKMLVIAEDDYFRTFYDPLGFSNYIAMSFLRRFPCLFIGSAMTDKNLRRFLYHLRQERGGSSNGPNHFAILRARRTAQDDFEDAILLSYGVATIWIKDYDKIPGILKKVYAAAGRNTEEREALQADWETLREFKWGVRSVT